MGSLERRLERLEARTTKRPEGFPSKNLELYYAALENVHRERAGLPLREIPYTEEDYHDDMRVIASLRADPGWDTELGHRFLDEWESISRESLEKGKRL